MAKKKSAEKSNPPLFKIGGFTSPLPTLKPNGLLPKSHPGTFCTLLVSLTTLLIKRR